ncbi:uncharacterized protein LOC113331871 [Papaver somniferum]|uniref:uncharacterized protein LOC113331871 n=1 Tax=Papaver somniferum TaxID=3469 RepID=UPI000E6F90AB|nr:uncharacterized protein LOC113331871 [Papaver somniferum]
MENRGGCGCEIPWISLKMVVHGDYDRADSGVIAGGFGGGRGVDCGVCWNLNVSQSGYDEIDLEKATPEQKKYYKEKVRKDAKALTVIQEGVDDTIFPKLSLCTRAKEAWNLFKEKFEGTDKTIMTVNAMRAYGEEISDQKIVEKVLRSLPHKYDHVFAAIEESKDLSKYTFNDLMGSLQAHEQRLNRLENEEFEEKALWEKKGGNQSCSIYKRNNHSTEECYFKDNKKKALQCYNCKRFGHTEKYCRSKPREEHAQFCVDTKYDELVLL